MPGALPSGRNIGREEKQNSIWAAATIPTWQSQFYASRALSEDGSHLFFNSFTPLVPRDVNGKADVYQWQAADSRVACEAAGAERYVPSSAGCLSLISSGESASDSTFVDASPTGRDVFFTTDSSLVSQDPGLVDVYDARIDGGFAPPANPAPCEGEACQAAQPLPPSPVTATAGYGAGNPQNLKPACSKGWRAVRRHGKWRCQKKKQRQGDKRSGKHGNQKRASTAVQHPREV